MIQRNKADIFSLVVPQMPFDGDLESGDEVIIQSRYDRLVEHGWVSSDGEETEHGTVATLTETGSAIIEYFRYCLSEETLGEELERGAGNFVDRAVKMRENGWNVVEIDDDHVVVTNNREERRYEAIPAR